MCIEIRMSCMMWHGWIDKNSVSLETCGDSVPSWIFVGRASSHRASSTRIFAPHVLFMFVLFVSYCIRPLAMTYILLPPLPKNPTCFLEVFSLFTKLQMPHSSNYLGTFPSTSNESRPMFPHLLIASHPDPYLDLQITPPLLISTKK